MIRDSAIRSASQKRVAAAAEEVNGLLPLRGKQLRMISLTALLPMLVLALEPSFVHARVLFANVPIHSSEYVSGVGFFRPWLITEVPPWLGKASLVDRLFPDQLLRLIKPFILVLVLWIVAASSKGSGFPAQHRLTHIEADKRIQ